MKILLFLALIFIPVLSAPAQNAPVNLEGQVICCADCWAEADGAKVEYGTAEDLLKAKSCVEGGDSTLLAVREGENFMLYQLEQGKYKLPGKNWLEFVGKRVAVSGAVQKKKNAGVIRVDRLEVLQKSIAEREAASVLGQTVELKLKDLFGTEQSLSQFKGRIVVLNFWATYCEPCRKEMPDLAAIQNEYAALGLQVIGASTDVPEDRPKVLQFIKDAKVNFPVWMGAGVADTTWFGLGEALPGTVIIDKSGKIVKVISGIVQVADLKKRIDSMLAAAESRVEKSEAVAAAARENVKQTSAKASSVPS